MPELYSVRLCLEPNPGDVYTVISPDVPGLITEGSTPEEILHNACDALDALVEAWRELDVEIPTALCPILADRSWAVE